MNTAEQTAKTLLRINAVKLSVNPPFTWTSGIKSPIYCDNRLLISYPESFKQVVGNFKKLIKEKNLKFSIIAGTATAAIPFASFLAYELKMPMVYIRHKSKDYGASKTIEGTMKKKARVLIIEDLISTGGSAIRSVNSCQKEYNANVVGVLAIFNYEMEKSKRAFKNKNVPLYTLSNFPTLVEVATDEKYLAEKDKETVLKWSKDPEGWVKTLK